MSDQYSEQQKEVLELLKLLHDNDILSHVVAADDSISVGQISCFPFQALLEEENSLVRRLFCLQYRRSVIGNY